MRATDEQEQIEEKVRGSNPAGLLIMIGLLLWLGLAGSWSAVTIVLALVVMIFLHELGHFLTAKWAGMKVTEFFLGFGPRIWSFQRGETEYGVKAIPAGAYVRIIGMSNLDEIDPADEERTYRAKPYWRRLSVAVAGSTMHFILAFALVYTVFIGFGSTREDNWVLRTVSGPAAEAGLQPGDRILSLDGRRYGTFDEFSEAVRSKPGKDVSIAVDRGGARQSFTVTLADNRPGERDRIGYLGVAPRHPRNRHGPVDAAVDGATEMGRVAKLSVVGIGKLFSPDGVSNYVDNLTESEETVSDARANPDRPTSVVGIVRVGSDAAKEGIVYVLYLLFAVNMFIGIFNLSPLLPFDGGHVAIATYEKIRSMLSGRRYQADVAKLMPLTYAVVAVLALLFVTTIYLDIAKPLDLG